MITSNLVMELIEQDGLMHLHPVAKALLLKFMSFDETERCFELHIPVPSSVSVNTDTLGYVPDFDEEDGHTLCDAIQDIDAVIEGQEGLTYNTFLFDGPNVTIQGLAWG